MATTERTRIAGSRFAMAAGIVGLILDAAYLGIIFGQNDDAEVGRVAVFALFLLAMSVLALVAGFSSTPSPRTRLAVLGAVTGGFLTAGVAGILSIGLPLLGAGVACGIAWARFAREQQPVPASAPMLSVLAAIGTGALLVLGIALS